MDDTTLTTSPVRRLGPWVHYVSVDTLDHIAMQMARTDPRRYDIRSAKREIARAVETCDGRPETGNAPLPRYVCAEWAGERGHARVVKVIAGGGDIAALNRRCAAAAGTYGATAIPMPVHDRATCMDYDCIVARMSADERAMSEARGRDMDAAERRGFGVAW